MKRFCKCLYLMLSVSLNDLLDLEITLKWCARAPWNFDPISTMSSTTLKKLRRKNLILFIEIGWRKCKRIWGEEQIYRTLIPYRSGSALRASRSPEPSSFLSPTDFLGPENFLGPEKPRKRSRSLFGGLFAKKEVSDVISVFQFLTGQNFFSCKLWNNA